MCMCVHMCVYTQRETEIKKHGAGQEMETEMGGKIWDVEMETEKEGDTHIDYYYMSQE